ncbi:MAG: VOC family protein [Iamia sp.]
MTFDCRHPASLARFWAEVLDGYPRSGRQRGDQLVHRREGQATRH